MFVYCTSLYLEVGDRCGSIAVHDESFDLLALIVEVPEEDLEANVVACLVRVHDGN